MNRTAFITILLVIVSLFSFSQETDENFTAKYVNGLYYYNRLDFMRSSYDRWQGLMKDYHPGEDAKKYNAGVYSAMNDFNFASDADGNKIYPMLIGYAFGKGMFGYYFLLSTTDVKTMFSAEEDQYPGHYSAATLGLNFQTKWVSVMGDATLANSDFSFYGKVYIPLLKSHFGAGTSPYDEIVDPVSEQKKVVKSEISLDQLDFSSNIIPYASIGLKLYRLTKTKYMPNVSFAAHSLVDEDLWGQMKYDAEFFFETRGEEWKNFADMKDYDVRLTIYRLLGSPLVDSDGICVRWTLFGGVSYKSEINYFTETITESGLVYNGQNGVGFELGGGLRVLGFTKYGFKEDTYVKLSYFYNYSQYFERFPGIKHGVKFKVMF